MLLIGILIIMRTSGAAAETASNTLAAPESFSSIGDVEKRSVALFTELGKVLSDPRCVNCHPAGDRPHQGDLSRLHQPPVERGADGFGLETMRCPICHQSANFEPGRMPGHPQWHLAPREMGWEGKTLSEICVQIKDPERNGTRDVAAILKHVVTDSLVQWAWAPGPGRAPAPGTNAEFGALLAAWAESGSHCPAP